MIKAVLFDLDGVLIETRNLHFQAFHDAVKEMTGETVTKEVHDQHLNGLSTISKLMRISGALNLSSEVIEKINLRKQDITKSLLGEEDFYNPDLIKILDWLKSRNIKVGICSNTVRTTLDLVISKMRIAEYLEISLSNNDVNNPKPSPEIYLNAIEKLGFDKSEVLIIEDSLPGLEAALASKANVQPVSNPEDVTISLLEKWI